MSLRSQRSSNLSPSEPAGAAVSPHETSPGRKIASELSVSVNTVNTHVRKHLRQAPGSGSFLGGNSAHERCGCLSAGLNS